MLPEREKIVLALNYSENMTIGEVGEFLGVADGRISQLHFKAVRYLRSMVQGEGGP